MRLALEYTEQRQVLMATRLFVASLPYEHRVVLAAAAAREGKQPEQLIAGALADVIERYRAGVKIERTT